MGKTQSTLESFVAEEYLSMYGGKVSLVYDDALHAYTEVVGEERFLVPGCTTVCAVIDKSGPLMGWAARCVVEYIADKLSRSEDNEDGIPTVSYEYPDNPEDFDKLLMEAKANYRKISKEATDIGQLAHNWLEGHAKAVIAGEEYNQALPDDPKAQNCIAAAMEWQGKHNFIPVHAELKVFSRRLGVAGTTDWVAYITSCGDPSCCPFEGTKRCVGDYKSSKTIYDEYRIQLAFYKEALEEEFREDDIELRVILHLGKENGEFDSLILSSLEDQEADLAAFEGALALYNWSKQLEIDRRNEKAAAKALKAASKPVKKVRLKKVAEQSLIPVEI